MVEYLDPRPSKSLTSNLVLLAHALIVQPQLFVSKNLVKPKKVSVDLTGHTCDGRCKHLVPSRLAYCLTGPSTHETDYIHEMIVTANRTCVLLASENMITQRIDAHLAGAKHATVSVGKHLWDGRSETPAEKKPAKHPVGNESPTYSWKGPTENQEGSS